MSYEFLDNPPDGVIVQQVGQGAGFQFRVRCICGNSEQTFSPTEANEIVKEYAQHDHTVPRLTKRQAAIIGLFTGVTCGPFGDIQQLGDELLGRSTWTHGF